MIFVLKISLIGVYIPGAMGESCSSIEDGKFIILNSLNHRP